MASKKKAKRQTADYLLTVRRLSKYVPSLKKFKNRQRLTKSEKATIRRRERQLNLGVNLNQLHPVTKLQAKRLGRKKLFLPGIQAIQLRGVKPGEFKVTKHGDIEVTAGEGRWLYWSLDRETVRSGIKMEYAGQQAFKKKFPIELVADLTALAFSTLAVQQVQLWAHAGRVGDAKKSAAQFVMWVQEKWQEGRYVGTITVEGGDESSDPGKWVNGIAILLENPDYTKRRKANERAEQEAKHAAKN